MVISQYCLVLQANVAGLHGDVGGGVQLLLGKKK